MTRIDSSLFALLALICAIPSAGMLLALAAALPPGNHAETTAPASDPYGFLGWLNATRASSGLAAVEYDAELSNWAAANNARQAVEGMGHYVMGPARRQNAGEGTFSEVTGLWMDSPPHRDALLDPSIRFVGIAGDGRFWTFNGRDAH